jgi:hypothetical protein
LALFRLNGKFFKKGKKRNSHHISQGMVFNKVTLEINWFYKNDPKKTNEVIFISEPSNAFRPLA